MGSPDFAVPTLDALVEAGHEVVAAYTPAAPPGRAAARREQPTPVHERAERAGDRGPQPASLQERRGSRPSSPRWSADVAVVAAYGLILPQPILDAPRLGCLNVHASLLPRWRGAAPIQRAILAGDEATGVTIMQMEAGLDTGPMLLKRASGNRATRTPAQLTEELGEIGRGDDGRSAGRPATLRARSRSPRTASPTPPRSQGRSADRLVAVRRRGRAAGPRLRALPRRLVRSTTASGSSCSPPRRSRAAASPAKCSTTR